MKSQREGMQVVKHLNGQCAHGILRNPRKKQLAQFGKQGGRKPQRAIHHQQCNRHGGSGQQGVASEQRGKLID
ncbi:MAG: hypothetical protein HC848_07670 [Limnobacter sp.]|nr:hypothetical protein [Limnobacter sp.]